MVNLSPLLVQWLCSSVMRDRVVKMIGRYLPLLALQVGEDEEGQSGVKKGLLYRQLEEEVKVTTRAW